MSKLSWIFAATVLLSYAISRADTCDCRAPIIMAPVCGDDGETYPNEMSITCMNECDGTNVAIVNKGPCDGDEFLTEDLDD